MKLAMYRSEDGPRLAVEHLGRWVDLAKSDPDGPADLTRLVDDWDRWAPRLADAAAGGEPLAAEQLEWLVPLPRPGKVICIGLNYADHARETGAESPSEPVVFNKFPSSVIGPNQPIVLPALSTEVDYEAELVAVIGRRGKAVDVDSALDLVMGYTCGHDVSARDWQKGKPGKQWLLGKTFDTFAPLGPWLVTSDEVGDPGELGIRFRLNGELMQDSSTRELIFSVAELVAYVSGVVTLEPGDVIYTGTPAGVGAARQPPVFLKPGDVCEVEIDGVGVLSNPVVANSTS